MKICTQSSRWFQEADPDGSLRYIKEIGFDSIEYSINNLLPADKIRTGALTDFFDRTDAQLYAYFAPLQQASAKHGVSISQTHAPFPLYVEGLPEVNSYMLGVTRKCCAVCAFLKCPVLVLHPFVHPDKETERRINLELFRALIPAAKKYGITLCLENMFVFRDGSNRDAACSDAAEACWYVDTLNSLAGAEVFGFCLDVGHANVLQKDLRAFIVSLGKRLKALHIHDNNGISDGHLIPYTQNAPGKVDWNAFVEGLRQSGYQGALSFETFYGIYILPKSAQTAGLKLLYEIGRSFRAQMEE